MKPRTFILMAAVLAATALFVACTGNDDDNGGDTTGTLDASAIRTDKGLAVAAAGQALGANFGLESADGAASVAVGAPAAPGSTSVGGGGGDGYAVTDEGRLGVDIAPYPFAPALQQGTAGLTVQGYGSATAAADEAVIEMWFYRDAYSFGTPTPPFPEPAFPGEPGFDFQEPQPVDPITEAELAPVIAALESFGADVEFIDQNYGYKDPYYSNVSLRATMSALDAVDDAVDAANNAADGIENINRSSSNVFYSLSDCSALERAAMEAAAEDAEERADVLADVLGVGRGAVTGASSYSYAPYDDGSCSSSYYYGPVYAEDASNPGPTDVQVFANVGVTYAIQ